MDLLPVAVPLLASGLEYALWASGLAYLHYIQ